MKTLAVILSLFACILFVLWQPLFFQRVPAETDLQTERAAKENDDYFFRQRSFPYGKIDYTAHQAAQVAYRKALNKIALSKTSDLTQWQFAGPVNIGGRIVDIEFDPTNTNIAYLAAASGGIFKTKDGGNTWLPVFDEETTMSIGDIAVAPSNPSILYVGTGEANGGSGSLTYDANGIYKSTDGGETWTNIGLQTTRMTGRVAVHPTNPDIVFAATMGDMYGPNPDRGLYKSTDGGLTWNNVLFVNDSTGAIDVVINPQNADIVFAVTWMRTRHANSKDYAGVESGIWKSTDGGNTFSKLGAANGLPPGNVQYSRIGIDLCSAAPNVLYCVYINDVYEFEGLYKSTDDGDNWTETNDASLQNSMGGGQGYWYGRVKCDPTNPDILFLIAFDIYKTINGGNSFSSSFYGAHVDQHAVAIHPLNHNLVMLGNDGGLFVSTNGGNDYTHNTTLPISQIYRAATDALNPNVLYVGLQDNGTSRTMTGMPDDYEYIFGGDGFQSLVKPDDSNTILVGYQYGNIWKSIDGGYDWNPAYTNGIFGSGNWNYPLTQDPHDPDVVYTGTQYVFKSDDFGGSWTAISPALTQLDNTGNLLFGTITFIDVSSLDENIIYAGTDDGKLWRTLNGGSNWLEVDNGLPLRWITCVATDPFDEHTAYVTLSGYRFHDNANHVYKTTDDGLNWDNIGGDLPDVPVNCFIADPSYNNVFYLATDAGVYYTLNGGINWQPAGTGMPAVPCVDLKLHQPTRTLVAGTYGRSAYKLNLDELVTVPSIESGAFEFNVFPNPVSAGAVTISYSTPLPSQVNFTLQGYDGKIIKVQKITTMQGKHTLQFDLNQVAAGVYLLVMQQNGTSKVRKLVVL